MTSNLWPLVEFAARPLDRDEREAVLGDSLESGESASRALTGDTRPRPPPAGAALEKLAAVALRLRLRRALQRAPHGCIHVCYVYL